jgi:general secretion pathway protein A
MNCMEIPYTDYFGLNEKPFSLTPDPAYYFESKSHKDALEHLRFFLDQREGFALIYGDVGTGKTTLSRIFLTSLDPELYATALILNPIMDDEEFLRETLHEFSIEAPGQGKKDGLDALKSYLLERHGRGKRSLLLIDEAQLIRDDLFEFIRVLSNFETDKEKILQIVFFAQPEIIARLQSDTMRYLSQRITIVYALKPLDLDEVGRYISYRLFKAGSKALPDFGEDAIKLIHSGSKGYPRLINILCDRCLLILYSQSRTVATRSTVKTALKEMNIALLMDRKKRMPGAVYIILSVAALALLILFWWDFMTLYKTAFTHP